MRQPKQRPGSKPKAPRGGDLAGFRWPALALPPPPDEAAWKAKAEAELQHLRIARAALGDDAETMFARMVANGADAGAWGAVLASAESFEALAKELRNRAAIYDQVTARLACVIDRAAAERPEIAPAIGEAARLRLIAAPK